MSTASNTPDRDRDRVTRSPDTAAERPSSTHADAAAKHGAGLTRVTAPKASADVRDAAIGEPPPIAREDENPRYFQRNFDDARMAPEKRAELTAKYLSP